MVRHLGVGLLVVQRWVWHGECKGTEGAWHLKEMGRVPCDSWTQGCTIFVVREEHYGYVITRERTAPVYAGIHVNQGLTRRPKLCVNTHHINFCKHQRNDPTALLFLPAL